MSSPVIKDANMTSISLDDKNESNKTPPNQVLSSIGFLLVKWYLVVFSGLFCFISSLTCIMMSVMLVASIISLDWMLVGISITSTLGLLAFISIFSDGFNGSLNNAHLQLIRFCNGMTMLMVISSISMIAASATIIKDYDGRYVVGVIVSFCVLTFTTILAFVMTQYVALMLGASKTIVVAE